MPSLTPITIYLLQLQNCIVQTLAWSNVQLLTSRTFLQNMYYWQGIRMAKLLVVKTNIRMNTTSGGEEDYSTVLPPPWDSSPNTQTKVSYLHILNCYH